MKDGTANLQEYAESVIAYISKTMSLKQNSSGRVPIKNPGSLEMSAH